MEFFQGFGYFAAINVGHKMTLHFVLLVWGEGFHHHFGPEVGAANADINDIRYFFSATAEYVIHRYPLDAPPYKELAYLQQADIGLELLRIENPQSYQPAGNRAGLRCIAWQVDDMQATLSEYDCIYQGRNL